MIDIELSRHLAMADGRQSVSYYCIDKVHSATGKRCLVLCKMFRVHFLSTMAGEVSVLMCLPISAREVLWSGVWEI